MENHDRELAVSGYPRPPLQPGTPEQILAFGNAYAGFSRSLLIAVLGAAWFAYSTSGRDFFGEADFLILAAFVLAQFLSNIAPGIGFLQGCGMPEKSAIWVSLAISILLPISSIFLIGFVLYAVLICVAAARLFKFGIPRNIFWTIRAKDVRALAQKRRHELTTMGSTQSADVAV